MVVARVPVPGENDMATTHPDLAAQWHPTKNGNLRPNQVFAGTNKKIWWVCALGHEWLTAGNIRLDGSSCPYCAGRLALAGFNDLATTHPDLAAQWHPSKNGELMPTDVVAGTNKKIWWLCEAGHEWMAVGSSRVAGTGCSRCLGRTAVPGSNDLATTHPSLAEEWHPTKNDELMPADVVAGTNQKIWWQCSQGHEWAATGYDRKSGRNCGVCSGKTVLSGFNDLASTHPEMAAQWHPTKNGRLKPADVVAGTSRKIWWLCEAGHEWSASGNSRVRVAGPGCVVCLGQVVVSGFNDMATTHPDLAAQWHPTMNGELKPSDVVAGTGQKVWWRCSNFHEWRAAGSTRLRAPESSGCGVCAGREIDRGFNDLFTTDPELAAQWHPTKNGEVSPSDVVRGTNKKFWWLCSEGHEWETTVNSRSSGRGCPACAERGFNPNQPGILYFLRHDGLHARKIGITNQGTQRIELFRTNGWKVLHLVERESGSEVRLVETLLLAWLREDLSLPPYLGPEEMKRTGGWTETFSGEGPSDLQVIRKIGGEFTSLFH